MELTIKSIILDGIQRGLKNIVAIIVNFILWLLTIWIPYLNAGTTIGLRMGIVLKMKKGETISMTEIFDPIYRKRMGEIFLAMGFYASGTLMGSFFLVIPGIVISLAWSQSLYLVLEKEENPIEAITKSNTLTYGKKWTMFGAFAIYVVALGILGYVLSLLGTFGFIIAGIFGILSIPIWKGMQSVIYGTLVKD